MAEQWCIYVSAYSQSPGKCVRHLRAGITGSYKLHKLCAQKQMGPLQMLLTSNPLSIPHYFIS